MNIVRARNQNDWEQIREICCLTGKAGDPIAEDRWPFFSEEWVGPYQLLLPEFTYVVLDSRDSARVLGYLTGCLNTQTFECRKKIRHSFPLFLTSFLYKKNGDVERFRKRFLLKDKSPEQCFSASTQKKLAEKYPAHLHMNFREEVRGRGFGKKIAEIFFSELKAKHAPGCHLFCGPRPLEFYKKIGFEIIDQIEFRPGVWVYCMGIKL